MYIINILSHGLRLVRGRAISILAITLAIAVGFPSIADAAWKHAMGAGEFILNPATGAVTVCSFQFTATPGAPISQCSRIGTLPAATTWSINVIAGGAAFFLNTATGQVWLCSFGSAAFTGTVTGACLLKGTAQ